KRGFGAVRRAFEGNSSNRTPQNQQLRDYTPQESASGRRSGLWNSMLFAEHRHLSYVLRSPALATARSDHREHRQRFQRATRHEQALHIRPEIRWIDKKSLRGCEAEVIWHQPFENLAIFE